MAFESLMTFRARFQRHRVLMKKKPPGAYEWTSMSNVHVQVGAHKQFRLVGTKNV